MTIYFFIFFIFFNLFFIILFFLAQLTTKPAQVLGGIKPKKC
jgi:hypothetical protein